MSSPSNDYIGLEYVWFIGVVEDRVDPLRMGRVRVRIYGWYSEDKAKVPVDSLPWAQVIQSPTSAAMGDIGTTPLGLIEGSWVVGFFLDGNRKQRPIVLGSLAGIPQQLGSEVDYNRLGFTDPNGVYPSRKDEPDVNRLARNDINFDHEVETAKTDGLTLGVPTSTGSSWDELDITYGTEYPYNHVRQSESGHIQEWDDTPGQERIHEYHKAGTFYEIDKDGNKVTRIVGDSYEVTAGSNFVNVKGSVNLTIDSNCNTYIKGNYNLKVDGDINTTARNIVENISGNVTTRITGNLDIDAKRIDLN